MASETTPKIETLDRTLRVLSRKVRRFDDRTTRLDAHIDSIHALVDPETTPQAAARLSGLEVQSDIISASVSEFTLDIEDASETFSDLSTDIETGELSGPAALEALGSMEADIEDLEVQAEDFETETVALLLAAEAVRGVARAEGALAEALRNLSAADAKIVSPDSLPR